MSPKSLTSRHSIDSCMFQLHTWKPFTTNPKTLDSDHNHNPNPNPKPNKSTTKRQCLSDRATSLFSLSIDSIDFSKLSLFDDGPDYNNSGNNPRRHGGSSRFRWMAKKRRRRGGSRSVSGRSSDRSGTRNGRCCSVGATATATCSDFMVAGNGGTDSSGELFGNGGSGGNGNGWASDVSEAAKREREKGNGVGERESLFGFDYVGQGNESGYGSEPGYRGDAEFGYGGDEVDDDDEDARLLLWGDRFGIGDTNMEMGGENTFSEQKAHAHHRGRRKKHDWRMMDSLR